MNYWASTRHEHDPRKIGAANYPNAARAWGPNARESANCILIGETLSKFPDGNGNFMSEPVCAEVPFSGSMQAVRFFPGRCFIGSGALIGTQSVPGSRYRPFESEFDWARHCARSDRGLRYTEARGWR